MANERDRFQFDEAALGQIENIRRIGLRRLRNRNEIDDFVQETLLRAFSKRSQLRDEAKFEAWIAAIARNLAREWNRAYCRRKRAEAAGRTTEAVDSRNPLDALEKAEERELLKQAVARLNESDREILRARYVDDASYAELQERYGLSYSAVGLRLHRAKRRLRKIYMSIAAALSLFFGSFKQTAWGGAVLLMNKTKVAVGIAAVFGVAATTGVVVVKKHASIPPSDSLKTHQQASTPSSATSEAAMDENGHKETAMDDNGHEKTGAAATPLPHRVYVPKADEPLAYRLFWQEVGERLTVEEMQSDPERAKETLRAIAEKHADGNADAETYFFLDAEWKLKEKSRRFISSDKYRLWLEAKKNLYGLDKSEDADLVHIYLSDRYASDTEKIDFYTKPLDDWVRWIRENAPSEWDAVEEAYSDNQWKFLDAEPGAIDGPPRYTYENFPTVEQRARAYYIAFFEAVALLPDDAAAFTVYFGSASPASEERHKIEDANPRQDAPPPPSPSKERQAASDEAAAVEAAFEQAVQDSIRRYGPEEGLRRLIVSDHDWIERIGRLQERRQEETPPPPED
ncbi:MAG: sigma-70 family RNA polymerase sigma factor [Candidatus Poribacteria bacterium]|nr:sigma-70 family RNA polymerase sigma factor [Candidatus Poribacteria bacterium]